MKSWRERLIEYGTYFIVFLTPIMYYGTGRFYAYTSSKTFFLSGAVELVFAFWLYQAYIDASYRFSKKDVLRFGPLFAYIAWLTIAAIAGVDPAFSFWSSLTRGTGLITLYHLVAFMVVIASLIKKFGFVDYGYRLLGWFIGGASILTVSIWFGNEGFNMPFRVLERSKGGGLMGNSSLAAAFLVFALFFAAVLLSARDVKKRVKIFLSIVAIAIIFSPLFISPFSLSISARGAAIGIVVGIVTSILFYLALSKGRIPRVVGALLIAVGVLISVYSGSQLMSPGTNLHNRFADAAGESRFIFWYIAAQAMHERPILGYGPENYRVAYQVYFNPRVYTLGTSIETTNDRAHNSIYDVGVAGGYPAVLLYSIFLGSLMVGLYRAYTNNHLSRLSTALLASLLVAYCVQNLLVFDSVGSLMGLMVMCGIVFGLNTTSSVESSEVPKNSSRRFAALVIVVVFVPMWVWCTWMPSRKAHTFAQVVSMSLDKRAEHYVDLLKGSRVGNAYEVGGIAQDSYQLYLQNQDNIKSDERLWKYSLIDLQKLIAYLEVVADREQSDYRLRLNLARLYNTYYLLSKDKDSAILEKALVREQEAIALSPNDPQIYWAEAITRLRTGDRVGAIVSLDKAIEIAPYIAFPRELKDQISK